MQLLRSTDVLWNLTRVYFKGKGITSLTHFFSGLKSAPFRPFCFHENSWFWFKWKPPTSLPAPAWMCLCSLILALLHVPSALPGSFPSTFAPGPFTSAHSSHSPARTGHQVPSWVPTRPSAPQGCLSHPCHTGSRSMLTLSHISITVILDQHF